VSHVNANTPFWGRALIFDQYASFQTDSFGRNMSTQLILCQYQNNSFMESLILAQDERWRRA
jgi:hypothetical protein